MGMSKNHRRITTFQIIILGFMGVILLGALLLMLPISSKARIVTPFDQALFTATSAVCVTGLVVQDTALYWSVFGQSIILLLIQIGGLGVITVAVSLALLSGKRLSLKQTSTMQEALSAPKMNGIIKLVIFVIKGTFLIELIGAILLMPVFIKDFGAEGIWMSFFHSISAFCNAGFDVMGTKTGAFSSLTAYSSNVLVNVVVMSLIIIGGLGFLTWQDIVKHRFHFKRYRMQSKVIIATTLILIFVPFLYFFFVEFEALPIAERILTSLFQAVTPRTAGFNTTDYSNMTSEGQAITIILMLIGGSPGSTAGGMKTTTIAVLVAFSISAFRRKKDTNLFSRRLEDDAGKNASTILFMYLVLFLTSAFIICGVEKISFATALFETASAIGTVGLSLGITSSLGIISKLILIVLMFFGRVGGLTIIYAALSIKKDPLSRYPQEKITVG